MSSIHVKELFLSPQGEGTIALGKLQIFLRTAFCNMSCDYCDTDFSKSPTAQIETVGELSNPVEIATIAQAVRNLKCSEVHSFSHTGGGPLVVKTDYLKELYKEIIKLGIPVYLETSGTLYKQLEEVIPLVRYISMDFKLPSVTGMKSYWEEHGNFLQIIHDHRKEAYTKIVFGNDSTVHEIVEAINILKANGGQYPLVLQPVSSHSDYPFPVEPQKIVELFRFAQRQYPNTFLIPQTHKMMFLK